jgi:hypothetical protein
VGEKRGAHDVALVARPHSRGIVTRSTSTIVQDHRSYSREGGAAFASAPGHFSKARIIFKSWLRNIQ